MPAIQQTLTITLDSETLSQEALQRMLDSHKDALAVFILNLLATDEINSELRFDPPSSEHPGNLP